MPDSTEQKNNSQSQAASGDLMTRNSILGFGIYFVVVGFLLLYMVFVTWPPDFQAIGGNKDSARDPMSPVVLVEYSRAVQSPTGEPAAQEVREVFQRRFNITYDQRMLLMVFFMGALGSYIHTVTSFADYVGNRRLVKSWIWWYLLRPFAGAATAVAFYFTVRAGFMAPSSTGGDVNRFGIAAIAMLVGMFSMKATDKLGEVFDVLFKTQEKRKDALENGVPVLKAIKPDRAKVQAADLTVILEGSNFSPKAVVLVNGTPRTPLKFSATTLDIVLTAAELGQPGKIKLAVKNPTPANALSEEREFTVTA
jgi:hypothetical protein